MPAITSVLNASVTGEGAHTIVLANGLGTTQHTWRHVVDAFAPHCRIVRFDHAGTTSTDLADFDGRRYATLHGYADDAVELLDALDVGPVTWVGHSVSGTIGLLAAVAAPERIGQLVLISASPRYLDDADYPGGFAPADIDALLTAIGRDYHAWISGFSPLAIGRADCPEAIHEFSASLRRMRPDVAHQILTTIFTGDYRAVLPRVEQPVTVVQPRDDVAVPVAVGRYLAARLPHASYRELDVVGHVPHLTDPDAVIAVLRNVLAGVVPGVRHGAPLARDRAQSREVGRAA